jgi:large subunit ribosomal protein L3
MAGRLGGERVTTLNIDIIGVDGDRDLLLLGGAVPGPKGSVVLVREAVKARG